MRRFRNRHIPALAAFLVVTGLIPSAGAAPPVSVPIAVDEAGPAGIAERTSTWGAAMTDVNGDGWPDFLVSRHSQGPAQLFVNDTSGHFTERDPGAFSTWQERLGAAPAM